jgi:acyl transferase domain-containing protein/acyl carrier protein
LEQAPAPSEADDGGEEADQGDGTALLPGPIPLLLSAKSKPALQAQASRLAAHLQANPGLELTDVAYSLATTRSAFEQRGVVVSEDREQLLAGLSALASGAEAEVPGLVRGMAGPERRPVFLFPGQGSQWQGMARQLLDRSPAFARCMDECELALAPHIDFGVRDVISGAEGAASIDRIEVVQPVLFAVTVSLASLWRACGVRPAAVAGHSQGEIAAAHVAGGLSLEDAAMLAAVRSRVISALAGQGAMVSVALPAAELGPRIERWEGRVEVAAINGPSSTILAADGAALGELLEQCAVEEVRARQVPATIPSHSSQVEVLREELLDALGEISPHSGEIPFHSTVTGEPIDTAELDAEYWYSNLRQPVRFEQVTRGLLAEGHRVLVEVSPHPVFALAVGETIEAVFDDPGEVSVLGTLRRDEGGPERFALSLATAHAAGVEIDWEAFFKGAGAKVIELPTYAFQRERYWIESANSADPASSGQATATHPLLGAEIEVAGGEGRLFTGRLSLATHPWLAEHAVNATALLPGAAFVDLALATGAELGTEALEELIQEAPLLLPQSGAVQIQLGVGEADQQGRRSLQFHSRPEDDPEAQWTRNASGALAPSSPMPAEDLSQWPPAGGEPIEVDSLYGDLAEAGFQYGPTFQGLSAAWRRGEELFAEVSLGEESPGAFAIHPALLDAALHLSFLAGEGAEVSLPFAWSGVGLNGAPTSLRVRLTPAGKDGFALLGADASGIPAISIERLALRPLEPGAFASPSAAGGNALFSLLWQELPLPDRAESGSVAEPWHCEPELDPDPVLAAQATAERALAKLQRYLSSEEEEEAEPQPLALITQMAVAAGEGESPDLAAAPLWGLLRAAQAEHPGRFILIDTDGTEASATALEAALGIEDEPQLAIREGKVLAARLGRMKVEIGEASQRPKPTATTLITGASGTLGTLLARHMVEEGGARNLILASRRGAKAPGAVELKAELEELGASVELAACDVAERDQLEALLASIPAEQPLKSVIHAAGVIDDGIIDSLTPERLQTVLAPKARGAWNLHELTKDLELSEFVLFSSAAATLGSPGQGNYAAANVFLDALAQRRQVEGLAASSIAWGLWASESAMSGHLGEADLARMRRAGMAALEDAQGLELFDAAIASGEPTILATPLELKALRSRARAGELPALFRGLVRTPARRTAPSASLAQRLAGTPAPEREALVLDLVRSETAAVLGHASPAAIDPAKAFKELGFDSLAAVELRNRLTQTTGVRLPATSIFDHPSPAMLSRQLLAKVFSAESELGGGMESELNRFAEMVTQIASEDQRDWVADRLRELVASLYNEHSADLADATDDEMFELLDKKLGRV